MKITISDELKKGHWNYRVMRRIYPEREIGKSGVKIEGEEEFAFYEVYYDDDDKPDGWSKDPQPMTALDVDGIRWTVEKLKEAMEKPVLDYDTGKEI